MRRHKQDDAEQLRFGDYVTYDLRASHGGEIEGDYVLGFMDYSHLGKQYKTDRNVVLLGGPKHIGMPINVGHCAIVSRGPTPNAWSGASATKTDFPASFFR